MTGLPPPDPNAPPPRLPHHTYAYLAETKGPTITVVCISVCVVSTLFVMARLFTRQRLKGHLFMDDYFVGISILFQWACVALAVMAVHNGNGRHFDTLTLAEMQSAIFWTILGFPFGIVAFALPKLAVVALVTRLLLPEPWHRIFLWVLTSTCFGALLGCVVILFAQCSPADSQWDFSITEKTCIDKWVLVNYAIFAGGFSAFTDLYLAVYPAIVLWGLQMKLRKKLALSIALGIGSIATVVAVYKCTRLPSLASDDFSYNTSDLVIWTIVEGATIIIACCIPVLQPLADLLFGRRAMEGSSGYKKQGETPVYKSDAEMNRHNNTSSNGGTSKNDTIPSTVDREDVDSQEIILAGGDTTTSAAGEDHDHGYGHKEDELRMQDMKPVTSPTRHRERRGSRGRSKSEGRDSGRIMRTDVVTVTYARDSTDGRIHRRNYDGSGWM